MELTATSSKSVHLMSGYCSVTSCQLQVVGCSNIEQAKLNKNERIFILAVHLVFHLLIDGWEMENITISFVTNINHELPYAIPHWKIPKTSIRNLIKHKKPLSEKSKLEKIEFGSTFIRFIDNSFVKIWDKFVRKTFKVKPNWTQQTDKSITFTAFAIWNKDERIHFFQHFYFSFVLTFCFE